MSDSLTLLRLTFSENSKNPKKKLGIVYEIVYEKEKQALELDDEVAAIGIFCYDS